MQYRQLGQTDVKVSLICLGTMTWGEQNSEQDAHQQIDYALDAGVNFIDTAEMYAVPTKPETQGLTEQYIGTWLASKGKGKRDKVILATKIASTGMDYIRPDSNLRAGQIVEAVEKSLKRLQTDYIDLYQLHWPSRSANFFGKLGYQYARSEKEVPIEETLRACDKLIQDGKIRHLGLSNETAWGVAEFLRCSREFGLARVVSIQNPYNLLNRTFEIGLAEFSDREAVGLLAYSPLAMGQLTGKYRHGAKPDNARLVLFPRLARYTTPLATKTSERYLQLADDHGLSPTQMALAYVNSRSFVTSNIIGATTMDQLRENIGSIDLVLNEEVVKGIEQIHLSQSNPCP
jgi:aryl-alcohol dehydrogenase-like predicted oxidoreductase